jgi:hypothetical protein
MIKLPDVPRGVQLDRVLLLLRRGLDRCFTPSDIFAELFLLVLHVRAASAGGEPGGSRLVLLSYVIQGGTPTDYISALVLWGGCSLLKRGLSSIYQQAV